MYMSAVICEIICLGFVTVVIIVPCLVDPFHRAMLLWETIYVKNSWQADRSRFLQ